MIINHRPNGKTLARWEADLLKLRAFEMVLILFYVEDLKQFILASIQFTDKVNGVNRLEDDEPENQQSREGKKIKRARAVLVSEGIITQAESNELKELLDYRNTVAHRTQHLTVDVGAYSGLTKRDRKTFKPIPAYDYSAATRAKQLRKKIMEGMRGKFIMSVSIGSLAFEAAETTYATEIKRLQTRVNKGIDQANAVIAETNRIIDAIPRSVKESVHRDLPRATNNRGTLNKLGASYVFRLFEEQATPLAVAYMMRISLRSANFWFEKWQATHLA
ncbi:hypothetical protein [Burkholderia ambifaria]|uniref:hypothetical protein n=1 Tax=Burkholderia ambifaria TaxID=152480 RepID=UPI00158F5FD8|nr:hypothetical protein [Burkholderia ambifaria]